VIHAVDVAESQVGVAERTGKNDGIPAERYMRGDALAWCAGFVLWCNESSDDPPLAADVPTYYRLRSVASFVDWAKDRGRFFARGTQVPQRNDIVFFGDTASDVGVKGNHVGIVTKVEAGRIHTVEGNTSNKVARRSYVTSDRTIMGFCRWGAGPMPR